MRHFFASANKKECSSFTLPVNEFFRFYSKVEQEIVSLKTDI